MSQSFPPCYRNRIPPKRLIQESLKYHRRRGNLVATLTTASIALFQEPPAWTMASIATTDWALLQQAKAMRNNEKDTKPCLLDTKKAAKGERMTRKDYPLASAAAGITMTSSFVTSNFFKLMLLLTLLACGTVAIVTGIHNSKIQSSSFAQLQLGYDPMFFFQRKLLSDDPDPLLLYLQRRFRLSARQELEQKRKIPLALPSSPSPTIMTAHTTLATISDAVIHHFMDKTTPDLQHVEHVLNPPPTHVAANYEYASGTGLESRSRKFIPPILRQSLEKLKHAWSQVQSWLRSAGILFQ